MRRRHEDRRTFGAQKQEQADSLLNDGKLVDRIVLSGSCPTAHFLPCPGCCHRKLNSILIRLDNVSSYLIFDNSLCPQGQGRSRTTDYFVPNQLNELSEVT